MPAPEGLAPSAAVGLGAAPAPGAAGGVKISRSPARICWAAGEGAAPVTLGPVIPEPATNGEGKGLYT